MRKPIIIGIAGGSASGKTQVSAKIRESFGDTSSILTLKMDDYYNDQKHLTISERIKTNYDHPLAFDFRLMVEQLDKLSNQESVSKPTYDFVNHTRSDVYEEINPCDVIVIEGLFVLEESQVRDRCDIKVYIDTADDIRFIRRLIRDVNERGRTLDSIISQYVETVRVMHEQFIEPSKKFADIIIPEGGQNLVAVDLLITKISSILNKNM